MSPGRFWSIPRLFTGRTVLCVASGPSVGKLDLEALKGVPTIAVCGSALVMPWADYAYFGDNRWWRWYGHKLGTFAGRILTSAPAVFQDGRVLRVDKEYTLPLSLDPTKLAGLDSGAQALNAAVLSGASTIVLAGYDLGFDPETGAAHHHRDHPEPAPETNYTEMFLPLYPAMLDAISALGVKVVRITPSRLTMVPEVSIAEALGR